MSYLPSAIGQKSDDLMIWMIWVTWPVAQQRPLFFVARTPSSLLTVC